MIDSTLVSTGSTTRGVVSTGSTTRAWSRRARPPGVSGSLPVDVDVLYRVVRGGRRVWDVCGVGDGFRGVGCRRVVGVLSPVQATFDAHAGRWPTGGGGRRCRRRSVGRLPVGGRLSVAQLPARREDRATDREEQQRPAASVLLRLRRLKLTLQSGCDSLAPLHGTFPGVLLGRDPGQERRGHRGQTLGGEPLSRV